MEWPLAYLALGAFVGFSAGLFGIGGGTLLVPMLLFLFDAQHFPAEHLLHLALGTSMANILFTALASTRKPHQHGAVNWHVVRGITPGILVGTGLGAVFATSISPHLLGIFFALFVYFAAAQILLDARPEPSRQLPGRTGMTLTGIFTGWLSALVSIGGGTVIVPFLLWCNVTFGNAIGGTIGYALTGMNVDTLPAHSLGFVYLPALFWVALASVFTAPFGARATHRMKTRLLRKLFAILLLVLATKLLVKVFT